MIKIKRLYFLLFMLSLCNTLLAQIQGKVVDGNTGEPLSFVNVYYDGKGVGTTTDDQGNFIITAHVGWNKLTFSSVGYENQVMQVSGNTRRLDVKMYSYQLAEVVVKPKREKYSRKNNPAVEFMKKVIENRKLNDLSVNDYYSYNIYERLTLSLNNITMDSLTMSPKLKKYPFLREQVEYCPETGKNILPVSINETLTEKVYRKDPESEKNIVKGLNSVGVNELFNTGDILDTLLKDFFQKINIYDDKVRFVQFPFDSPIGNNAISFYRYYIMDTLYVERDKCVHLTFAPNNPQDFGFIGHLYVLADSTYRVKKAELSLSVNTGINYVDNMKVIQEFEALDSGEWVQKIDDMMVELKMFGAALYVRRSSRNTDYSFSPIHKKVFKQKGKEITDVNAMMRDENFWREYRIPELTKTESSLGDFVNNLSRLKGFKTTVFIIKALIENFMETGSKKTPSKLDIGPFNTVVSNNYIDGWRFRLPVMTTANLNPNWFFKGYYAYGLKDKRSKYMGAVTYSFDKKQYLPEEFPQHTLTLEYKYDDMLPSDKYLMTDKDNMFAAFKFTKVDQFNYERYCKVHYLHEREYGLKTDFTFKVANYEPCGMAFYRTLPQNAQMQQDIASGKFNGDLVRNDYNIHDITTTEASLLIRYAPGESFINTKNRRIPINLDAPVFSLQHTIGFNGLFGGQYSYNYTNLTIYKRLWLGSWGNFDTYLSGGIEWNKTIFPNLIMPAANLSYLLIPNTFSLMNNMEFPTDRFGMIDVSWNMHGKIFNRIPLLKKLKLREFIGAKVMWGTLTDKNNPFLEQNKNDDSLIMFPGHYKANGEFESSSHVMDPKTPYVEVAVGVHNIFKLVHIDYVRRLTYLDFPTANKWGIRFAIMTVF